MASKKKKNKKIRKKPYNRKIRKKTYNRRIRKKTYNRKVRKEKFKYLTQEYNNSNLNELDITNYNIKNCTFLDSNLINEKNNESINLSTKKKKRKLKKNIVLIFIILSLLSICTFISYFFVPYINLDGEEKLIINYKEKYKEKGYTAKVGSKNITKSVKVTGKVNSNKLGTYKIIYKVKYGIFNIKKTRKIIVKDKEKPTIKLKGSKKYYVCKNKNFKDPGYEVLDNYDKNLKSKVKIKNKNNVYTYTVKDTSGNKISVKREVIYKDKESPSINFDGQKDIFITTNQEFDINKVTAHDNCDGDLTADIKIKGNVNTKTPGDYKVTYEVVDSSKNKTKVERTIHVMEKGAPGTIYLTFDDGPHQGVTNVILDILKEENVKATFFVTNKGPDDLIIREHNEGHTVALHTSSHDYAYLYSSVDNYFIDLYNIQNRVYRLIGIKPTIIRFPGGSSNTISRKYSDKIMTYLTREVLNRGFKYYDWNISSGDAGEVSTSEGVYNMVTKSLSKERVNMVLMHDIKHYTKDALRNIIRYAKENGYTFDVIDDKTEMIRQKVNN